MLNNYHYFIALAEEKNISRAAERLFISHQCLSKYLKNLEQEYRVTLFDRVPQLRLTPAGQTLLETFQKVQLLEQNLESQMEDIRQSKRGLIRLGTTEGRYRILIPDLLARFKKLYPDVVLDVQYASSSKQLNEYVLENKLDMVILNRSDINHNQLEAQPVLDEDFYLVISDNMLETYFPGRYPECRQDFSKGVDLAQFQKVPFVLTKQGLNSREILEKYLQSRKLTLNCILELTQLDLHLMMAARDLAAGFCWSMYVPTIRQTNEDGRLGHLNVFPIKGRKLRNQVVLVTRKGKIFPAYGKDLIRLIKEACAAFIGPLFLVRQNSCQ